MSQRFRPTTCNKIICVIITQSFLLTNFCFALGITASKAQDSSTLAPSLQQVNPADFGRIISGITKSNAVSLLRNPENNQQMPQVKYSVLDIARENYRFVSISMGGNKVAISLNNGNNDIIDYLEVKWNDVFEGGAKNADADAIMNLVAETINTLLKKNQVSPEAINKVSSNLCGPVDKVKGIFGSEFPVPNLPIGDKYPFRAKLQEKISVYGISAYVEMVNDAEGALKGETYSPKGTLNDYPDGGVTIIGGGINSAIKKNNQFYAGEKGEFKEFGHNLVRKKGADNAYHYQWVGSSSLGNHPIEAGNTPDEIIRKSGDKGKAYLANPNQFVLDNPDYPMLNWADGDRDFEDRTSGPSINNRLAEARLNGYNVENLTEKAAQGDEKAIAWIKAIGREVGEAHAALFAAYPDQEFIKHWALISGVNENLGKGVYEQGKTVDIYIDSIRQSLTNGLVSFGMDKSKAKDIAAGMVRSNMTYDRELISYKPTDADIMHTALSKSSAEAVHQKSAESKAAIALVNSAI
ncbi:MAG: ROK family protein [Candidatus Omnitrophica bacterium]|nr:ROK family protein [Candidatus Omnitrophota bacterium]